MKNHSPSLQALQASMAEALLTGSSADQDWFHQQMALPSHPAVSGSAQARERMDIYRNNVMYSLTQAMKKQFPVVAKVVGENFFLALAKDYLLANPRKDPVLTLIGESFPEFIRNHRHCATLPYLPDLASLEWHCQKALHSADDPLLTSGILAQIEPETLGDLVFSMNDSAHLLESPYPVFQIWEQHAEDNPAIIDLDSAPSTQALIYRKGFTVKVINLTTPVFEILQQVQNRKNIAESWLAVSVKYELSDQEFPTMFAYLMGLEVFSKMTAEDN